MSRWLVVNGPQRTGSTAAYNTLRLASGSAIGLVEPWVMDRVSCVRPERPTAVKVHEWRPEAVPDSCAIVLTMRSPLDVAASRIRQPEVGADRLIEELDLARDHYAHWRGRPSHWLGYETYIERPTAELAALFAFCGLEVDWEAMTRIVEALRPEKMRTESLGIAPGALDPATELRHAHVSETLGRPGAWRNVLTAADVEILTHRYVPWFDMGGYERPRRAA